METFIKCAKRPTVPESRRFDARLVEVHQQRARAARRWRTGLAKLLLYPTLAGTLLCAGSASAQEMMRETLTTSSEPAPTVASNPGATDYNLRVGPVKISLDAAAGIEYIDNISYSQVNRTSDEVVRLGLNILTVVPLTHLNALRFNLGIGFVRYLEHPQATSGDVFITPGSQLALTAYIGDYVKLDIHDAFDIRQDPVDSAELSNVTNFGRFTNTAGITATVDLHDGLVFTGEYDHFNYLSLNSEFDYLDREAEQFAGSVSYQIRPRIFIGVDGGYSITDYTNGGLNDSTGGTVGGFLDATLTPYFRLVLHGGYQFASFDTGGTVDNGAYNAFDRAEGLPTTGTYTDKYSLSTFFWSATLNNRINAYLTHSLSLGREADLGLISNYVKVDYIRYSIAWRVLSNFTLAGDLFYDHDVESGGPFDERINRYGGDVSLGYQVNRHLSVAGHYAYIQKDSDAALRDYYQNRVGLDVDYHF